MDISVYLVLENATVSIEGDTSIIHVHVFYAVIILKLDSVIIHIYLTQDPDKEWPALVGKFQSVC